MLTAGATRASDVSMLEVTPGSRAGATCACVTIVFFFGGRVGPVSSSLVSMEMSKKLSLL